MLSTFPATTENWTAEACLCSIAQAVDDLAPLLSIWQLDTSEAATRHLAEFIAWHADELRRAEPFGVFWEGRVKPRQQIVEWLLGSETAERLEEAFFRADEPFATELSQALDVLTWAKVAWGGSVNG